MRDNPLLRALAQVQARVLGGAATAPLMRSMSTVAVPVMRSLPKRLVVASERKFRLPPLSVTGPGAAGSWRSSIAAIAQVSCVSRVPDAPIGAELRIPALVRTPAAVPLVRLASGLRQRALKMEKARGSA